MQTGTEQSRVPSEPTSRYLGIAALSYPAPQPSPPLDKLVEYLQAAMRPDASQFGLRLAVLLKSTARGAGKATIARWAAARCGLHVFEADAYELVGETEVKTEGSVRARFEQALACAPCVFVLRHVEALARKSQAVEAGQDPPMASVLAELFATAVTSWRRTGHPLVVVGTTSEVDKLPASVVGAFKTDLAVEAPNELERLAMLRALVVDDLVAPDVSLRALAVQTAALVATDLVDLVARARSAAWSRVAASAPALTTADRRAAGVALTHADVTAALDGARSSYSESIGAPKIPTVGWDDVGGLASVKAEILDTIQLPLERPDLFADGLKKRSGVLLFGPPGTGKTLLAKAVATSCSLNFFSVKGPELLNMCVRCPC